VLSLFYYLVCMIMCVRRFYQSRLLAVGAGGVPCDVHRAPGAFAADGMWPCLGLFACCLPHPASSSALAVRVACRTLAESTQYSTAAEVPKHRPAAATWPTATLGVTRRAQHSTVVSACVCINNASTQLLHVIALYASCDCYHTVAFTSHAQFHALKMQ